MNTSLIYKILLTIMVTIILSMVIYAISVPSNPLTPDEVVLKCIRNAEDRIDYLRVEDHVIIAKSCSDTINNK